MLMLATMTWGRDKLILPNYEYEIICAPSQTDIIEAFGLIKADIESPLDLTSLSDETRKVYASVDAMAKDTYTIKSVTQSNDTISVNIELLHAIGGSEGKIFTLGRTNEHLFILQKSGWIIHSDTFSQ